MAKDISRMTVGELKILAYDTAAIIQNHQKDLDIINSRIAMLLAPRPQIEDTATGSKLVKPVITGPTGPVEEEESKEEKQ